MRVNESIEVRAPRELVWEFINEPDNYLRFMSGITRWEVEGEPRAGLGARYRMLIRAGSAEVGGLIEIVESHEGRDMAWTSVTGIDQRGRWRLRETGRGRTRVEIRYSYGVAGGGLFAAIAERVASPTLHRHMRRSLHELKRLVEHEAQRRERAAATPARV